MGLHSAFILLPPTTPPPPPTSLRPCWGQTSCPASPSPRIRSRHAGSGSKKSGAGLRLRAPGNPAGNAAGAPKEGLKRKAGRGRTERPKRSEGFLRCRQKKEEKSGVGKRRRAGSVPNRYGPTPTGSNWSALPLLKRTTGGTVYKRVNANRGRERQRISALPTPPTPPTPLRLLLTEFRGYRAC